MEKYNLVGKNLEQTREEAERRIDNEKIFNSMKMENELEKTSHEKALIQAALSFVSQEMEQFSIPSRAITIDQIHLFQESDNSRIGGLYDPIAEKIEMMVTRDKNEASFFAKTIKKILRTYEEPTLAEQEQFLTAVAHETVHHNQFKSYHIPLEGRPGGSRQGYVIHNNTSPNGYHEHFRGFNEAVTSRTEEEIWNRNKDYIKNTLGLEAETEVHGDSYTLEKTVLDQVIFKLAEVSVLKEKEKYPNREAAIQAHKDKKREVWDKIKAGQFTGNLSYLREVEYAYGPGALRILSHFDGDLFLRSDFEGKEAFIINFLRYFKFDIDPEERKKIGEEIMKRFPEAELQAFQNHIQKMEKK